jgi:hypothetical protein
VSARSGELAALAGHDLAVPEMGSRTNNQISVTRYYRGNTVTDQDLTRFA